MVEFKNVNIMFEQNKQTFQAVKNVSFKINKGEVFGIVGSSGAGKSTLLRTINLLQPVTSGQVIIDGENIVGYRGKKLSELRKNIGMIFQHFNLVASKTVYQNIEFVLREAGKSREEADRRIKELLHFVGLSDKIDAYPSKLSGGQKQRVAIARALANDTKILLCDEPTSALDLATTESVLNLLKEINEKLGITIIMITHELDVVKTICDRIAVMNHGEVVEIGNTYELFTKPQADFTKELVSYTQQFELPQKVIKNLNGTTVKLTYLNDHAEEALISQAANQFEAHFNILHGKIEYIHDRPVGILYINIEGEPLIRKRAIRYLQERTENLEVIYSA